MNTATRILVVSLAAALAAAQTASYDVATIKFRKGPITFASGPFIQGRTVTATALTPRDLISYAYTVRDEQLTGGPSWIAEDHYDVIAKSEGEGALKIAQSRQMMQSLLADRFQLQLHREKRDVPMYGLVVAKNGPKFAPATETTRCYSVSSTEKGTIHMEARCVEMEQLVLQLAGTGGRYVVNQTGLTGRYAFTLDWWPANRIPPPDSDAPSMFKALEEQLGLKLEAARGPVEMLVIDHAEKPSEN
jgi:uncharacterized protein (TIGR03435 family)